MTGAKHRDKKLSKGSALILTVVLSSILAIVAVLFLLASRVETLSTSSLTDERDLNLAVDTIISKLSDTLVLDTPGVAGQEYYDYPGEEDKWLASIEPYRDGNNYEWDQITDLTGYIADSISGVKTSWDTREVSVNPPGNRTVIKEYPEITLDNGGNLEELWADADGDGIADSKWIELEDDMGSRGRRVFAAIRIVDNTGTLNTNTAYQFDSNSTEILRIDGSRLHQINLDAPGRSPDNADAIFSVRSNLGVASPSINELNDYEKYGAWKLADPCDDYTLFDISDELELRYRFLVNSPAKTRIENTWSETIGDKWNKLANHPFDASSGYGLDDWESRFYNPADPNHDRRHMLSVYDLDRIIAADAADANTPDDIGMINVNFDPCGLDNKDDIYTELNSWRTARDFYIRCAKCLDVNLPRTTRKRMKRELAQLAVNMVDLRDADTDVTNLSLPNIDDSNDFNNVAVHDREKFVYGIEPYPVITKVGIRIDPNDPCKNPNYYGVELFNPFSIPTNNREFSLVVTDFGMSFDPNDPNTFFGSISIPGILPGGYVILQNILYFSVDPNMDPNAHIVFPQLRLSSSYDVTYDSDNNPIVNPAIVNSHNVCVVRNVRARLDETHTVPRDIFVDRQLIYKDWVRWDPNSRARYYGRDFDIDTAPWWDVVYSSAADVSSTSPILGRNLILTPMLPRPAIDITLPYGPGWNLRTVGDIARIWTVGPTSGLEDPNDADNRAVSPLFDPNTLDFGSIDPNNPADVNDPNNTRFASFNDYIRTVGEKLLFVSLAQTPPLNIEEDEDFIRLNLADPLYVNLFQYITVFDPRTDGIDNDDDGTIDESDELKIPGRININTAPYFVIQQLPWMSDDIAKAIVDYRDRRGIYDESNTRYDLLKSELSDWLGFQVWRNYIREERGFASIGELNLIANRGRPDSIWEYGIDKSPLTGYPDLTKNNDLTADEDDFEERDVIFARISNLVTVRSDIFTAYILVRLGRDGPQKRVVALLDRSGVYKSDDKVKILAVHDVSYPR